MNWGNVSCLFTVNMDLPYLPHFVPFFPPLSPPSYNELFTSSPIPNHWVTSPANRIGWGKKVNQSFNSRFNISIKTANLQYSMQYSKSTFHLILIHLPSDLPSPFFLFQSFFFLTVFFFCVKRKRKKTGR